MRILIASGEVHPYSKTGGLADMVGALAKFLARAGHQVGVVTPLYRGIREKFPQVKRLDWNLTLPLGSKHVYGAVWTLQTDEGATIYFVDQADYFDRRDLYLQDGQEYPDNAERFLFFSKAVVNLARYLPERPDIVHVHDWQAGLVPMLLEHAVETDGQGPSPTTCLTIHNLAYQGVFSPTTFPLTNLPRSYFHLEAAEFYGYLNFLKAGIVSADFITTVSPRYAREITTELLGCGLDGVLRRRQSDLFGILNGVDYDEWRTDVNPQLRHTFTADDLTGKLAGKADLQTEMGLPPDPSVPLFANVTRLTEQKGVDIQIGALEEMLHSDMQFVLLGSGSAEYERAYQRLAARYPGKVAIRIGFNHGLSHRIEAGADFYLMPSRFEPCGLNQMYSLRYGTLPLVRATGGLDDSVIDPSENEEMSDGIKFREYSSRALARAIRKALVIYAQPDLLSHFRRNAMTKDFSWNRTVAEYVALYEARTSPSETVSAA